MKNCPFYGRALYLTPFQEPNRPPFVLYDSGGNQCGLVTTSHTPCRMEVEGEEPNWQTCPLVRMARAEDID